MTWRQAWMQENGLGERLRQARKAAELSADEVGLEMGTSGGYIQRMERGEFAPSIIRIVELADLYGVSVDWLCGRTEET